MGRKEFTGRQFVKECSNGINIRSFGGSRGILDHLRRREMRGHIHLWLGMDGEAETEISDLRDRTLIEKNTEIIQVTVDESRIVSVSKTLADCIDD